MSSSSCESEDFSWVQREIDPDDMPTDKPCVQIQCPDWEEVNLIIDLGSIVIQIDPDPPNSLNGQIKRIARQLSEVRYPVNPVGFGLATSDENINEKRPSMPDNNPQDMIKHVETTFYEDVKHHQMTVLLDTYPTDVIRHLRFANPKHSQYAFTITTTPGYLTIQGDYGPAFTFRAAHDMLEFFQSCYMDFQNNRLQFSPWYWGEKLQSHTRQSEEVSQYSEEVFMRAVTSYAREAEERQLHLKGLTEDLRERLLWEDIDTEPQARDFLDSYIYTRRYLDEADGAPRIATFDFLSQNTWEWNLRDWTYSYAWACFALSWASGTYWKANPQPEKGEE